MKKVSRKITKEIEEEIKALLIKGTSLRNISKKFGIYKYKLEELIFYIWNKEKPTNIIKKDTNIYGTSEDWLLNGDTTTYKDLSPDEKVIYDNII